METISNVASAASKAIWGEPKTTQGNETAGQEPISGEQGKGTVNDPYDRGNSDVNTSSYKENPTTTSKNPPSTTDISNPTSIMTSNADITPKFDSPTTPTHTAGAAGDGEHNLLQNTDKTGVTSSLGNPVKGSDVTPSNSTNPGVLPDSGTDSSHKQQGADKPQAIPSHTKDKPVSKGIEDRTEEDFAKTRDPNDRSGEPLRMHDGSDKQQAIPNTHEERRTSTVGLPGGTPHGKELGSGEQHVKTTGLAADGGDFDATKPGAGREADRLLEEKGIRKSTSRKSEDAAASTGSASTGSSHENKEKEKIPLGEKIKNKLHIGHKDK